MCDRDGSNPVQLTTFGGPFTRGPMWSPNGREIAFYSTANENHDIYIVNAEGGSPRRLTNEPSNEALPSWSRDGRWIYFTSNRSGTSQVWKIRSEGGQAVQVTEKGGHTGYETADGGFIYYIIERGNLSDFWKAPVEGGEEELVVQGFSPGIWGGSGWPLVEDGVYFIDRDSRTIRFFNFNTRKVQEIARLEKPPWPFGNTPAVSPDGRYILYTQMDQQESDIMLVENFRLE